MSVSTLALRRNPLSVVIHLALPAMFAASLAHADVSCSVNSNTDDPATASATVTAATTSGTLRDCILAVNLATGSTGAPNGTNTISTTGIQGQTVNLLDSLPLIFNSVSISGSGPPVVIDGGGTHRIFLVSGLPVAQNFNATGVPDPDGAQSIAVGLTNLALQNGKAQGGSGGGGGMGAGGALFVNKNATVTLNQVDLNNNSAAGGTGAAAGVSLGGGGMGGNATGRGAGGLGGDSSSRGGGGVGSSAAGISGGGFGGTGIGQISSSQGFAAPYFGGATTFGAPNGGIGGGGYQTGSGGFGGGASDSYSSPTATTSGGFGGGGGSFSYEGGGPGVGGGFGGGGGSAGPGNFGNGTDGYTGFVGGSGGLGAGGAGGGGGGGCAGGVSGHNGGPGGAGGSGGVAAGSGTLGSNGGNCAPYGFSGSGTPGAGGGGAGLGGGVFVRAGGTLTVQSNSQVPGGTAISGGSVTAGAGANNGAAAGSGMFLMTGATTTFDIGTAETVSDNIQDDGATSLPGGSYTAGSGAGAAISKQGAGTLVLSGSNTYSGGTTISAGTLQVDGSIGNVTINGGTLSGVGSVGNVTLNAGTGGGSIAPGDSPGMLSASSLTWNGGSASTDSGINFQLGATNSTSDSDLIQAFTLNKGIGTKFIFHFSDGNGAPTSGTVYTLIATVSTSFALNASDFSFDYTGAFAGTFGGTFSFAAPPPPSPAHAPSAATGALQFTVTGVTPVRLQSFEVD